MRPWFQDGGVFYDEESGAVLSDLSAMVKSDFDLKGAKAARRAFIAAHVFKRPDYLFLCHDGGLYDTRDPQWSHKAALRPGFEGGRSRIGSVADLKAALRAGSSTDLGGYPLYFIAADNEALSFEAVRDNFRECVAAFAPGGDRSWRVTACEINYEDSDLVCAHTGERIPSAYADEVESSL